MGDLSELVDQAGGNDDAAAAAARELSTRGPAALPEILKALDTPFRPPGMLKAALASIFSVAPVEVLREGLRAKPFTAFKAAAEAARTRSDVGITDALLDVLRDENETPTGRAVIAEVLGNRGDPAAREAIRRVLPGSLELNKAEDDPPRLAVACVVALAKYGDFAPGARLVELLADPFETTRALAAEGLRVAIGPGMIPALEAAARDEALAVGIPAVEALFLLRCAAVVEPLLQLAEGGFPQGTSNATVAVRDILGSGPGEARPDGSERARWDGVKDSWGPTTCYRAGRPFALAELFAELRGAGDRRDELLREVVATTGQEPAGDDGYSTEQESDLVVRLGETGRLYRWGHLVDLADVT